MIDEKSCSLPPKTIKSPKTISCINWIDPSTSRPTGQVTNYPSETDPPPRDQTVGFWRLKYIKTPTRNTNNEIYL